MKPDSTRNTLAAMEAMLRPCRRRIAMAAVRARLGMALQTAAKVLLGVAATYLLLRAFSSFAGTPAPGPVPILALFALILLAVFVRALVSGFRGTPHDPGHAAERLDLAQAGHNRIATAIALLRSGDDSPFARAAIRDGVDQLERMQSREPHVDVPRPAWRRAGISTAAAAAMLIAGFLLGPKAGLEDAGQGAGSIAALEKTPTQDSASPDVAAMPEPRVAETAKAASGERPARRPDDAAEKERTALPEPGSASRSEGSMGHPAPGESRGSQAASNSRSAASGGGAKPEPGESEAAKPTPKPGERKPQTAARPKPAGEEKQGGSISASGSSGAGSMQSSQNEWSSKVKAKADDSDDFQADEAADEDMDPDKQRLGVQPALKNRSARISRELSLMMGLDPSNQQKRGRGGPGGQKKSRGTATMIMGVPVPGFLRGRLLAGPTKSTQEEVEPSPRDGEFAAAFDFPETLPEEDAQERFRAPAPMGDSARDYLIQYHDDHENRRDDAAPGE